MPCTCARTASDGERMPDPIPWLFSGPPWAQYRTQVDLLGLAEGHPDVQAARRGMLADPQVRAVVAGLGDWDGAAVSSHKSAGQPYHRLAFLAELELRPGDPGVDPALERILARPSDQGPFRLRMSIPAAYGGTGKDTWAWALCDAPVIVGAMTRMGLSDEPRVQKAMRFMVRLVRDNGWPCAVSPELGHFRGPGRASDPCPYATLAMLKAVSAFPAWRDGPEARSGAAALLGLWERSRELHPYMFYMGTDFRKLKAPLVWYDILHVLDVLSRFPWLLADPRLADMAGVLSAKADGDGRYTAESVWKAWSHWEFGQKRAPSRWITLLAVRVVRRLAGTNGGGREGRASRDGDRTVG